MTTQKSLEARALAALIEAAERLTSNIHADSAMAPSWRVSDFIAANQSSFEQLSDAIARANNCLGR